MKAPTNPQFYVLNRICSYQKCIDMFSNLIEQVLMILMIIPVAFLVQVSATLLVFASEYPSSLLCIHVPVVIEYCTLINTVHANCVYVGKVLKHNCTPYQITPFCFSVSYIAQLQEVSWYLLLESHKTSYMIETR